MSASSEPNPPTRKQEDFPKTNTFPEGWVMEEIMDVYNRTGSVYDRSDAAEAQAATTPVPTTGGYVVNAGQVKTNGRSHAEQAFTAHNPESPAEEEGLFTRRLDPSQSAWDLSGTWL